MENEKHGVLFVYAFYRTDGPEGVHEDLCLDVTVQEGVAHARKLWHDADKYRVSDRQIGAPYYFLFAPNRSSEEISKHVHITDMKPQEISELVSHLDKLNKTIV